MSESNSRSSATFRSASGHPHLVLDEIFTDRRRGVSLRLFIRQRNAFQKQRQDLELLHRAGSKFFDATRSHAKVAIGGQRDTVLFFTNLDAQHGLDSGVEVGFRLSEPQQVERLSRYLNHAIKHAGTRYLFQPIPAALDGKLAACWYAGWPYQKTLTLGQRTARPGLYMNWPLCEHPALKFTGLI